MILLLGVLLIVTMGLVAYALMPEGSGLSSGVKKRPFGTGKEPDAGSPQMKVLKLEGQVAALNNELEQAHTDISNFKNEIEGYKKKEDALKEQLAKREEWIKKSEEDYRKFRDGSGDFENKLKDKEKELQVEFEKNVDLTRQLRELQIKFDALEKSSKEMT
ncbi:MAG: hypothetical protein NT033_05585, partial [Candidatus Omnitrophica bacterium]|nr:hypothetical protein [Candidatus Omnitrophota bacterium]